jgi:hypothetical protein
MCDNLPYRFLIPFQQLCASVACSRRSPVCLVCVGWQLLSVHPLLPLPLTFDRRSEKWATMATATEPQRISDAVQIFALEGRFPDDIASLPPISDIDLEPAIQQLGKIRSELEVRSFSRRVVVPSQYLTNLSVFFSTYRARSIRLTKRRRRTSAPGSRTRRRYKRTLFGQKPLQTNWFDNQKLLTSPEKQSQLRRKEQNFSIAKCSIHGNSTKLSEAYDIWMSS